MNAPSAGSARAMTIAFTISRTTSHACARRVESRDDCTYSHACARQLRGSRDCQLYHVFIWVGESWAGEGGIVTRRLHRTGRCRAPATGECFARFAPGSSCYSITFAARVTSQHGLRRVAREVRFPRFAACMPAYLHRATGGRNGRIANDQVFISTLMARNACCDIQASSRVASFEASHSR